VKIETLRLSEQALSKLSKLAMAVELAEHKRFSVRGDIEPVVSLIQIALASSHSSIKQRVEELRVELSTDSLGFFRALGVDLSQMHAGPGEQTYRGQRIAGNEKAATPTPATSNADSDKPRKKIVYRGKVTYV